MTDTIFTQILYKNEDPDSVIDEISKKFKYSGGDEIEIFGPRTEYGVRELDISYESDESSLLVSLDAVEASSRTLMTPTVPSVEMTVGGDELTLGKTEDRISEMVDILIDIYDATESPPAYVYSLDPFHAEAVGEELEAPISETSLQNRQINDVSWLMLFPPEFVEKYGAAYLRDAPVWKVETLSDGGLLLIAVADPTDPDNVDYSELRTYFGIRSCEADC